MGTTIFLSKRPPLIVSYKRWDTGSKTRYQEKKLPRNIAKATFPGRQRKAVGGDASGRAVRRAIAVMSVLIRRGSAGYQLGAALAMETSLGVLVI